MLNLSYINTYIGDREENLDRFGHISGLNWSVTYLLDGFLIKSPHYVEALVNSLNITFQNYTSKALSETYLLQLLNGALNITINHKGKASAAFVISIDDVITTLTAGDTRVYYINEKERTKDHSKAQDLIDQGRSPESSLYRHPLRKYLTKSITTGSDINELSITRKESVNDVIICSDGVWSCFSSDNVFYDIDNVDKANTVFKAAKKHTEYEVDNITLMLLTR